MATQLVTTPVVEIPFGSLEQAFTYDGDFIETVTAVYETVTYIQTFTNNGTKITNITMWVAQ